MKWFDNWFYNKCKWAWSQRNRENEVDVPQPIRGATVDRHNIHDGMSFHLKTVIGGRLVTINDLDHKTDRTEYRTYVITDDQDFDVELCKIITMESMRR
mgnify:CR=1 FL=1